MHFDIHANYMNIYYTIYEYIMLYEYMLLWIEMIVIILTSVLDVSITTGTLKVGGTEAEIRGLPKAWPTGLPPRKGTAGSWPVILSYI